MGVLRGLIHSNLYIALAALMLTVGTQIQLGLSPQWHPYLFLIFFATLFEYNVHRLFTILLFPQALETPKHQWVKENKLFFYIIVSVSVIGFLITIAQARLSVLIALSPLALITIFYSTPFSANKKGIFRLRGIPFLKIFLIALVWSVVTVLLPVIYHYEEIQIGHIIAITIERFLFVWAITLPFDIRDIEEDSDSGLKTIPFQIGIKKTEQLSYVLIFLFMFLSGIHYTLSQQYNIAVAMLISGLSTYYFLKNTSIRKVKFYHYGILDGTMLLQGILILIANYLKC